MTYQFRQYSKSILRQELLLFRPKAAADAAIALVYPNCYELGINNLGFQTVYRLFNETDGVYAERAFLYPAPFESVACTLESNRALAEFDCLAFSVAFELDFLNMVRILRRANLPVMACDRSEEHPIIAAGGMVMFMNPAPVAPFLDVIFIGEAEGLTESFATVMQKAKTENWSRKKILENLAGIKGIFIPALHDTSIPESIERSHRSNTAGSTPNASALLTAQGMFRDMYLIEVGRGCPRGCRFCAAGYVYRPYRINTLKQIETSIIPEMLENRPVGLVGSAVSDYKELPGLMEWIVKQQGKLGISSFRVDELDASHIEIFERGGLRSIAVAPEAGSERMRRIIHKPIQEQEILEGVQRVARSRIQNLKLYFMLGLPFEEEKDLEAVVELSGKINDIYNEKGSSGSVKISCNAFVPKAFTPFQWSRMEEQKEIDEKRKYLLEQFRKFNKVKFGGAKSTREDILQGVFSMGDERTAGLIKVLAEGSGNWKKTAGEIGFDYCAFLHRDRGYRERLPWDFIKGPVPKAYLWKEWQRAGEEAEVGGASYRR